MRIIALAFLLPLILLPDLGAQDGYPKLSPFESLRPTGKAMEVKVQGRWYELRAIEGKSYDEVVAFCRDRHEKRAFKRFAEDLVQVLSEMGLKPGKKLKLELVDLESRKPVVLDEVEMTAENRRAVWTENRQDRDFDGPIKADERRRGDRRGDPTTAARRGLTGAQIASDLEQLETALRQTYSYLERGPADWPARLTRLREKAEGGMTAAEFHIELRRFLALFGDGHSRARRVHEAIDGWLPLAFVRVEEGLAAFGPGGGLADPERPFAVEIADRSLEQAVERASVLATRGSPALAWTETERYLSAVGFWAPTAAKRESDVVLADGKGRRKKVEFDWVSRPVSLRRPLPRKHDRLDEGRVGYIRLESMASDERFLGGIRDALDASREAKGLIIDLRGNGGGSRAALEMMLPRFLPVGRMMIANVAIYRLPPGVENDSDVGHLANRLLWPMDSSHWTEAQRGFIADFMKDFRPEWAPKAIAGFSRPHLMLVTGSGENADQEVVLLTDGRGFSATDVFVGAFAELSRVTILGEPTGGGSGRARGFQLASSGIEIRLSTMVSWRPNGLLYDGRGVEVDLSSAAGLDDWLGRGDRQLERALEDLRRD